MTEVDQTLEEIVADLAEARIQWREAETNASHARQQATEAQNREVIAGKHYNTILSKLNKEFGIVRV